MAEREDADDDADDTTGQSPAPAGSDPADEEAPGKEGPSVGPIPILNNPMLDLARRLSQQVSASLRTAHALAQWQARQRRIVDVTDAVAQLQRDLVTPVLEWQASWHQISRVAESVREATLRSWPANWHGVDPDIDQLFELATGEALCLVWVPRAELVAEVPAAANTIERRQLLEAHVDDIVTDCGDVLGDVDHPALREHRDRLLEAVAAHGAGLHGPGQAMSAVVLSALLQWVYAHERLAKVRKSPLLPNDVDDTTLGELKVALLISASVPAVAGGRDALRDEDLGGYNRNDTLHRVADEAYALPNAMTSLLLATGLLAEANVMLADGRLQT